MPAHLRLVVKAEAASPEQTATPVPPLAAASYASLQLCLAASVIAWTAGFRFWHSLVAPAPGLTAPARETDDSG